MKKVFAVLLAVLTCFCFVGCTDTSETDNGNRTETIPSETEQPTETPTDSERPEQQEITKMFITINGNRLEVELEKNSATAALVERLKQGDITYTANDYGDFEKVGSLGFSLPTSDTRITTQAGDVVLYSGNQIVLFYGSNTWAYTRLGKIDRPATELRALLGAGSGSAQVTISLE